MKPPTGCMEIPSAVRKAKIINEILKKEERFGNSQGNDIESYNDKGNEEKREIGLDGAKLLDEEKKVARRPFTRNHFSKEISASLDRFGLSMAESTKMLCDSLGGLVRNEGSNDEQQANGMKELVNKISEKMDNVDSKVVKVDSFERRLDAIDTKMEAVLDHNTKMEGTIDAVHHQLNALMNLLAKKN
jgi:hypothetical protein